VNLFKVNNNKGLRAFITGLLLVATFTLSADATLSAGIDSTNAVAASHSAAHTEIATPAAAHDPHAAPADGKFDPVPIIMHHIADANEFNILGHLTMPLPVIIYNKTSGSWFTTSSSVFNSDHHGNGTVEFEGYKMEHSRVHPVSHEDKIIDFSITKNVFTMLLGILILTILFLIIAKAYRTRQGQAPSGVQGLLEPIFAFIIDDIAKQNIGKNYKKFSTYLIAVFFFILICNLLGLIPIFPGSSNVSGNISFTVVIAAITFLMIHVFATKDYWMHMIAMPGVPKPILLILAPIELLGSLVIKPVALALRLFGNITGGHIAVLSITSMVFILGKAGASFSGSMIGGAVALPLLLFVNAMELFVAFLQAYVFTLLSAIFIGIAQEEHSHH
jgi:F-type H+-transporting ATPase subunit a